MAYSDDEIKRDLKKQRKRKDATPLQELTEAQKFALLEDNIRNLLLKTTDRNFFVKEIEKLTVRCGLRMGREHRENSIRLFDQFQRQKRASR